MNNEKNYDELLFSILHSEGQITGFLDAVFGFLNRRTDFFKVQCSGESIGLPAGVAEELVRKFFYKYYEERTPVFPASQDVILDDVIEEAPPADNEVLIETTTDEGDIEIDSPVEAEKIEEDQEHEKNHQYDPASYNGAVYDNYSWAQSIKDIDVQLNVPASIVSGKQVKVHLTQTSLKAEIFQQNEWQVLVDGKLRWPINVEESFWTLVPHKHIHVSLEKTKERWWDAFLEDEPQIDVKNIDATQPYEDLDEESQAKIRELLYNEKQKIMGKPTVEQQKIAQILKGAWDLEGSPFQGQPYDPNVAVGCSASGAFTSFPTS